VDKYTWVDIGSSYLPSDILAAYLFAQLEAREHVLAQRKRVFEYYAEHLRDWADSNDARLPAVPSCCEQSYHMFYMLLPSLEKRRKLIAHLKSRGILGVFHYLPLHLSPMGRKWGYQEGDCPVTEDVSDRLVRLPFYNELSPEQQQEVCAAVFEVAQSW
jgi:dTDP-4-amino-4,6-dideoxygalactose transaminase